MPAAPTENTPLSSSVCDRYEDAVVATEARLRPLFEDGELDEDDVVSEQLDAGLFTLQVMNPACLQTSSCSAMCSPPATDATSPNRTHCNRQGAVVVASALWASGDAGLRKRMLALLHQRGRSLDMVR